MKKALLSIIVFILAFIAIGCSSNNSSPEYASEEEAKEEQLDFRIENIVLSKGFQSTEPKVEVLDKTENLKLLANIGLIESSGVEIKKVTIQGKTINLYIDKVLKQGEIQLAVPQIVLEISNFPDKDIQDYNFNIVNQNYKNIVLKYNRDQILDRIYCHFKIEPNSMPDVELSKSKDQLIWDISFTNIFNRENIKSPLINLNVEVDANTGEILSSDKDNVSICIDDGVLLDYMPNNRILYKRNHEDDGNEYEALWTYNIKTNHRNKLYTSKSRIHSAVFSPNGQYISLIETNDGNSDLYIIPKEEKIAFKITASTLLHPRLMKWQDYDILYFTDIKDNSSTILSYHIEKNKSNIVFKSDNIIDSFDIYDDSIVYVEYDEEAINRNIFLSEDGIKFRKIGKGSRANFLDEKNIIYLEKQEEEDKSIFHVFNIDQNNYQISLSQNIVNYMKLDEQNIILIEKNTHNNDYTINGFNIGEKTLQPIAKINSAQVFYNSKDEKGYINLYPPHMDRDLNIIYSVDLKKLAIADANNP